MTRIFGHYVPGEMVLLWLIELTLCFGLGYATLETGMPMGIGVASAAAGHAVTDTAAVLAISAGLTSFAIGLYRPETFLRLRRLVAKTAVAGLLCLPAIWVIGRVVGLDFGILVRHDSWVPLELLVAWIALMGSVRLAFSYSLRMKLFSRRVVVIGDDESALRTANAIDYLRNGLFEVAGTFDGVDFGGNGREAEPAELMEQLRRRRVWGVVVASDGVLQADQGTSQGTERALRATKQATGSPVKVWDGRGFWEDQLRRVDIDRIVPDRQAEADAFAAAARPSRGEALVRRSSDVVLSLVLLLITLPLMLITALVIRLDSPGGVFYRQERVGLHGRRFVLTKFRSMRSDAEKLGPVWAAQGDSRVTRVGAFLRLTRIDELPQLINVLRGEMSFIGPRPERPHFVEKLGGIIPFYAQRAEVKPGLTGWAQVNYPYGASIEDARMKLSYDLYYVKHHSLFLDVLILFSTVRVILFQEGAR